jgi:hypothetical protein
MPSPRHLAFVLALLATGCAAGPGSDAKIAPACPGLAIVKEAADLTRFSPRGEDITDLVLNARVVAVPATCKPGGRGMVDAEVQVTMEIVRGPAAASRRMELPYFVAVTDANGRLLDKQEYGLAGEFPPNVDRLTVSGQPVVLNLPVSADRPSSSYRIFVGLALSPAEVEYNRRHVR